MTSDFQKLMRTRADLKLPSDEILRRTIEFLKGQTMCTLCTCRNNVPRATPLEYYVHDTALYMVGHQGVKLGNIRANTRVSIGVYNHVHPTWGNGGNWLGVKGVQITGRARLITDDSPEYFEARRRFSSPTMVQDTVEQKPSGRIMIRVDMDMIEYQDIAFKLQGYASKQVWKGGTANAT